MIISLRHYTTRATLVLLLLIAYGCGGSVKMANLSGPELFAHGLEKYEKRKYFAATEFFQAVIFSHPGASVVDSAQYYLGLSYFGNKEYTLAGIEFNRLLLNYPSSAFAPNAQFMKAVTFFEGTPTDYALDQSDLLQAIKQLEDFIIDQPESEMVPESRKYIAMARERLAKKDYKAGLVYVHLGSLPAAKIYFQRVVDDFTDTPFAAKAAFYLGESEMQMGNYDEARRHFSNFSVVFAEHEWIAKAQENEEKAAFLSGETAFKQGKYDLAREKLQFFIQNYSRSKKVKKAKELLIKISQLVPALQAKEDDS